MFLPFFFEQTVLSLYVHIYIGTFDLNGLNTAISKRLLKLREMEKTQREAKWNEEKQEEVDIWKYIFGFIETAVVKCAIKLGIPDAIESHGSPMTLSKLSSTLGCAPSPLYRIMRFLMQRGIFKGKLNSQGSLG